jgi:hypothetical protein
VIEIHEFGEKWIVGKPPELAEKDMSRHWLEMK